MEIYNELSKEQFGAIKRAVQLGRILQTDLGKEIEKLFRTGNSYSKIIEELDIQSIYSVSDEVAMSSMGYAIGGYNGGFNNFGIDEYEGLCDEEERREIVMDHNRENAHKLGTRIVKEKKGIHGRTVQKRKEDAKKAGSICYEMKKGVHAQTLEERIKTGHKAYKKGLDKITSEERKSHGKKGGQKTAQNKGQTIWTFEEISYAYQLSQQQEYQTGSQTNNKKIAEKLNELFHDGNDVRTSKTVSQHLYGYRKYQGLKISQKPL